MPSYAPLLLGLALSATEQVYVESLPVIGTCDITIRQRDVLPNVVALVMVIATLGVVAPILRGGPLSILGPGSQRPTASGDAWFL